MGTLSHIEKRQLERVLGMAGGYVLGFSNRAFEDFFRDVSAIEIYDSTYDYESGSKANRMRAFWNSATDFEIAKVLEQLRSGLDEYSDGELDPEARIVLARVAERLRNHSGIVADNVKPRRSIEEIEFSVALSFPGTHRDYVAQIANTLKENLGADQVFYDKDYQAQLARPNLDMLLQRIYRDQSKLVVVFLGGDYAKSDWCGLEWRAVRELIKRRDGKQLMFVRLDAGEVDGALSIDGYIDANEYVTAEVANFVIERIGLSLVGQGRPPDLSGTLGKKEPYGAPQRYLATGHRILGNLSKLQRLLTESKTEEAETTMSEVIVDARALYDLGVALRAYVPKLTATELAAMDRVYEEVAQLLNEKQGNIFNIANAISESERILMPK